MESPSHTAWSITAGTKLNGTVPMHGNKNAALPAIASSLLLMQGGTLILNAVPRIRDVETLTRVVSHLGISAVWTGEQQLTLTRTSPQPTIVDIPSDLIGRIRASITLLGPLSGMYQHFKLAKPGGDKIGGRPIGAHITALEDLGIDISDEPGFLSCVRQSPSVLGGTVCLTEQSVTATLMMLLYSGFMESDQQLTIIDAACEPHIVTLCGILESMGALIEGTYSNLLRISWPNGRHAPAGPQRLDDDFMEATTYAIAAAITRSDVVIPFANAGIYLFLIDRYMGWMGVATVLERDTWRIHGSTSTLIVSPELKTIKAEPWPRFPTDVMSLFVVLATQCTGTVKFVEYMYDDRFGFVQALRDIGARIETMPPHAVVVHGPTPLTGNDLFLRPDIRSGAAMLLAALVASGTMVLHDRNGVIARGYQQLPETLQRLGGTMKAHTVTFE